VISGVFGNDTGMAGEKMMAGAKVVLLCAVAAVAACSHDSAPAPAAHTVTQAKPKPAAPPPGATVAEQTAGMVQAATQGKSQLPVELKYDIAQRPKVGQPLDINLALIAQVTASPATIQVTGADDVAVAGAKQFEIPAEEAGEVYRETVNVTPNAEGVVLLGVTVVLKHDELVDQRVFSIPIIAER
jgi:hypothetical protein